jgi:hypothetical protein
MTEVPRILYREHPSISPEQARDTRARALAFAFRSYETKKNPAAGEGTRGEDGTEIKGDSADDFIIRHQPTQLT